MLKHCVLLLTITIMSLSAACNITDSGEEVTELKNTLMSQQDALFSNGADPKNPGQGEFYPLSIGNTWTYTGERSMRFGAGPAYTLSRDETRTITGTEELFGREYMLEEQFIIAGSVFGEDDTITYWLRHRQDRAGLYEADVAMSDPPGEDSEAASLTGRDLNTDLGTWDELWRRSVDGLEYIDPEVIERAKIAHFIKINAVNELLGRRTGSALLSGPPGGILPDEIQRLRYPLHPEQEWIIRDSPLFYSIVEGMDVLDLPAGRINGWRVFIYNEFLDDNDIVHFWFGRQGFLAMTVHLETEDDYFGSVIITDETLFLVSYDLEGKGYKREEKENGKKTESNGSELTTR